MCTKTRGRSTAPALEEEHQNTRCSKYNKGTEHDGHGDVPCGYA